MVLKKRTETLFTAVYKKRGKDYVGYIKELSGVNTQGKTLQEVKENLREALVLFIATNPEDCEDILLINARKNEKPISWEKAKKRLKKDGLL